MEKYLKPEEVAEVLGLSKEKVLELARQRVIGHIRLNKRVILFTPSDVKKFQQKVRVKANE